MKFYWAPMVPFLGPLKALGEPPLSAEKGFMRVSEEALKGSAERLFKSSGVPSERVLVGSARPLEPFLRGSEKLPEHRSRGALKGALGGSGKARGVR